MHRKPLTIHRDASLAEAVQLIVDNRLTGVTVTDDDGHICGRPRCKSPPGCP